MSAVVVEVESVVPAPRHVVWARVASVEGIQHELLPWLLMTMPRGTERLDVDTLPVGVPLGRAWLRLFRILPVDYDALMIAALEPGRRFHEVSHLLSARRWEHERVLVDRPDGSTHVLDRLTVEPRIGVLAPVVRPVVAALFRHRHRRLARWCADRSDA